jgi:hypothetical protein
MHRLCSLLMITSILGIASGQIGWCLQSTFPGKITGYVAARLCRSATYLPFSLQTGVFLNPQTGWLISLKKGLL